MLALLTTTLAFCSFAQALSITTPTDWTSPGNNTLEWTTSDGDPATFNVFLYNTQESVLNGAFALLNSVDSSKSPLVFPLGVVNIDPKYEIRFVDVGEEATADPLAASSAFSVTRPDDSTTTRLRTTTSASASSLSASKSSSAPASLTPTVAAAAATTSASSTSDGAPTAGQLEVAAFVALVVTSVSALVF